MSTEEKFEQWGIVEVFGHQKFAGLVSEQTVGGCHFVRIDVPEIKALEDGVGVDRKVLVEGSPAFTKLFGQGAIFSITLVTEEIARKTAAGIRARPLNVFDFPRDPQGRLGYSDTDEGDDWR